MSDTFQKSTASYIIVLKLNTIDWKYLQASMTKNNSTLAKTDLTSRANDVFLSNVKIIR